LPAVRDCLFSIFAATLRNRRTSLHPQPEDAPCRGDKGPTSHGPLSQRFQIRILHHHHHHHHHLHHRISRIRPLGLFRFRTYFLKLMNVLDRNPLTGDRPDARPLPTEDNTTQKNADIHPCLEWDSNPRSQCSSGRRQYVPQTRIFITEPNHFLCSSLFSNFSSTAAANVIK
jgi:hypothetical protein